ncbi:adenylate/guanylate cyclase domain-containing protein [Mycolicibacterium boenickei]|uniref:Adenylate/guanylate cyclase domain-containing protein n=1 Tax=Mycolicibacterium boenickei TaxID=146017 RepID=A0AAX2ZYM5_9MYCO|nr:adenylate/guanylate cyclase domain-containing protein [Mycolicibacterium boenickei]PEG58664.1 adenylate/guanylate cyclase domain-containing protein [Mycolicibacterium boenickei]UNC00079.1 adenylate/guanylate cyclase domain-containing protein [Mycolicibacterium boenickei]BBX89782.1 transcriptional regulator [Mycolicibacterium boenickei]
MASQVLTFLFTDIEGSTRRWEADPEAMRAALALHDTALREAITARGGQVFKHTGDGVCAVFTSPRAAVDAAVAAQRQLQLPVRMGIATGEAELRDDDYFGVALNRASRIMAAGHGGQILLDGATAGLLIGSDLITLGSKRLRDIAKPVDVYQIRAPGLQTEFPPLTTTDPTPGNLQVPSTSFIGRQTELTELCTALRSHRLVTLTGVGGVGKTRLALEVASRCTDAYPDGVFVIELAAVGDPSAVPEAAAAVLGITQQPGLSVVDSMATALAGRARLLVLDNCEHVLDAAADLIEAIFSRSSTVAILATSREGLRLNNEQLWPVPSLDVGTDPHSAAMALFVDRAHAVSPHASFTTSAESAAVVEICRRLDGIPLAIELAASRLVSMTTTEVRNRLDDRFRLLIGSRRGLERHQTLRHAVQWSYDLLSEDEKSLLARCSVFTGGFDVAAATAVRGSGDELDTIELIDALVRKSLLVADRTAAQTRFSMLETIRQFAEEQLVSTGDPAAARTAHAQYFAGLEPELLALWDSPHQREVYHWFNRELANLRTAFRWATDEDDLDTAATLAVTAAFLGYFLEQWEPIAWIEELIPAAAATQHPRLAQLYVGAANCAALGRVQDFERYADATRVAMDSGQFADVSDEFACVVAAGYTTIGHPERAVEWCRTMIARNPGRHTASQAVLTISLAVSGAAEAAMEASESLVGAADSDNPSMAGAAYLAYGWAHRQSDPAAAYGSLRRAWTIAQESGDQQQASIIAGLLTGLAADRGELTEAFAYIHQTTRHYYDSGSIELIRNALGLLSVLLDRVEFHTAAATISGFGASALSRASFPEIDESIAHLRNVLGDAGYDELARVGANMTTTEIANYAFDQIDCARDALVAESGHRG